MLASQTRWKLELLLRNEDVTNNIFKKQNISFTSSIVGIADWTKNGNVGELLRASDGNGNSGSLQARVINTLFPAPPSHFSASIYLPSNSYNPTIQKFIKGHRYELYADVKTDNTLGGGVTGSIGIRNVSNTHTEFMVASSSHWNTVTTDFEWTGETEYRDLEIMVKNQFGGTKYLWMDNFRVVDQDQIQSSYAMRMVNFDAFEVGTEGKDTNSSLEIQHSFSIQPLDLDNFFRIGSEVLEKIYTYGGIVKYWKSEDDGESYHLHWVGITDQKELTLDMYEKTIQIQTKSILAFNKDYINSQNPFGYSIIDSEGDSTFVPVVNFITSASNYVDDDFGDIGFYNNISCFTTLKGRDANGRYATLSGYLNGGDTNRTYLAFDSWNFFREGNSSFYAKTFGDTVDQLGFATNSRITTWFDGTILIEPTYRSPLKSIVDINLSDCLEIEVGIQDPSYTGVQTIVKVQQKKDWNLTELTPKKFTQPNGAIIVDTNGNVKNNAVQKTLVFYSDWMDTGNSETYSIDWFTMCGTIVSQMLNNFPAPYAVPDNWSVSYNENLTYDGQSYINCHQKFLLNNTFSGRTYIRTTVKGTDWSPSNYYRYENGKLYEIRKWTIDYVNNESELYLLEM